MKRKGSESSERAIDRLTAEAEFLRLALQERNLEVKGYRAQVADLKDQISGLLREVARLRRSI